MGQGGRRKGSARSHIFPQAMGSQIYSSASWVTHTSGKDDRNLCHGSRWLSLPTPDTSSVNSPEHKTWLELPEPQNTHSRGSLHWNKVSDIIFAIKVRSFLKNHSRKSNTLCCKQATWYQYSLFLLQNRKKLFYWKNWSWNKKTQTPTLSTIREIASTSLGSLNFIPCRRKDLKHSLLRICTAECCCVWCSIRRTQKFGYFHLYTWVFVHRHV